MYTSADSAGEHLATDCSPSQRLHSALTWYLSGRLPPPLGLHIGTALLSLARLPVLHASSLIPPLLLTSFDQQSPTEQALDQALLEGEVLILCLTAGSVHVVSSLLQVLQQYMGRSNCVGWLNRPQFEERWMQLLGVINQPPPPEVGFKLLFIIAQQKYPVYRVCLWRRSMHTV